MSEFDNGLSDSQRFLELLPFYVNKTISYEDRAFVLSYLERNPDVVKGVHFVQLMQDAAQGVGSDRDVPALTEQFVKRFLRLKRWARWNPLSKGSLWFSRPAAVFVSALLVVQSMVIFQRINEDKNPRLADEQWVMAHADARLTLHIKAEMQKVMAILHKYGARIVHSTMINGLHHLYIAVNDKTALRKLHDDLVASGVAAPGSLVALV